MATYEYWCPKCWKEFEVRKPMVDFDKPAFCPDCNAEGERLLSSFASQIDYSLKMPARPFRRKRENGNE